MNNTAILIVTYNSAAEIGACLEAAILTKAEILVIDNGSTDSTRDVVRRFSVRLLANSKNNGFAGAVNQGVQGTDATYLLLLNPDAVLTTGIERLVSECARPGVGAVSGLLIDENGKPQTGFAVRRLPTPVSLTFEVLGINRLFPRNPVNWRFRCSDINLTNKAPVRVEQPAGALFLFRRDCWRVLGGFDERFYPLWFEDVDFCARLRQLGREIWLVSDVVAKHAGAHSILNMALEIRQIYWYGNLLRYAAKHFSPLGRRLVCMGVLLGAGFRSLAGLLGGKRIGIEVCRLAVRCFLGRPGWDQQSNSRSGS